MTTKHVNNVLHYNCSFNALYYVLKLGKYPWALAAQYGITTISYFNHIAAIQSASVELPFKDVAHAVYVGVLQAPFLLLRNSTSNMLPGSNTYSISFWDYVTYMHVLEQPYM